MTEKQEIKNAIERLGSKKIYSKIHDLEFVFWDIEKMDEYNEMYNIEEFIPGYYGIGTNGGEEMLAVEFITGIVYSIPFIPMNESERIEISKSIDELNKYQQ
ncbi:MAG: hypothetical protein RBT61_11225 [Candidatus Kapabacteria bacterium]|jgi:hypothetical protein|nr:hypothetical protein [Candidatus Kapabacteria bacterium]